MSKKIETDIWTFTKFWLVPIGVILIGFLIGKALTGLIVVGISIFLALALRPLVRKVNGFFTKHFGKEKKHQTVSAVMAYLIVVLVIGAILAIVGPVVVNETAKFVQHFPETFETSFGGWEGVNNLGKNIGINDLHSEISRGVDEISKNLMSVLGDNLLSSVSSIADITMKIVLILVLTLLFLLEGPTLLDHGWEKLGSKRENRRSIEVAKRTVYKMANVVSTYVSHQMIVAVLDGCATMIIVFILSMVLGFSPSLAVPMGMITMAFYMIPMFGQFIGGTLVTVLLFFSSPLAALTFAIIYIVYAQFENNLIAPKIQGDALNLQPLIILCAVTIGMYMFGLLGAIVAIPIAGCIKVLADEYPNFKAARE